MNSDEERLDRLLQSYAVARADAALRQRVLDAVPRTAPWREWWRLIGGWRIAGPAFALSAALGVAGALWLGQLADPPATDETVWQMAGLGTTQEWIDE